MSRGREKATPKKPWWARILLVVGIVTGLAFAGLILSNAAREFGWGQEPLRVERIVTEGRKPDHVCAAIFSKENVELTRDLSPGDFWGLRIAAVNPGKKDCSLTIKFAEQLKLQGSQERTVAFLPGEAKEFTTLLKLEGTGPQLLLFTVSSGKDFQQEVTLRAIVAPNLLNFLEKRVLALVATVLSILSIIVSFLTFRKDTGPSRKPVEQEVNGEPEPITPHNLSQRRASNFLGREKKIAELDTALASETALAITAVAGMGGVGKSELTLQYAHGRLAQYPDGICWIDAREDVAIQIIQFVALKFTLAVPEGGEPEAGAAFAFERWPGTGHVLLVVDDWPETRTFPKFLESVPVRFRLLITSRETITGIRTIQLDVLAPEPARELLHSFIDRPRHDQETAIELVKWLGYLPLAIELVGSYLEERSDLSVAAMFEHLQQHRLNHNAFYPAGAGFTRRGIAEALDLSRDLLNAQELTLAGLLSVLAQAPIPLDLFRDIVVDYSGDEYDQAAWEEALHVLVKRNLLKKETTGFCRLHPLVREYFRTQETTTDSCRGAVARVLARRASQVEQSITIQQAAEIVDLVAHWHLATEELHAFLQDEDITWPHTALLRYYMLYGDFANSEILQHSALELSTDILGAEHPDTAVNLNNLAELFKVQGRYDEAEPLHLRALKIRETHLGPEHRETAESLNNLGGVYRAQGRYESAELLLKRSLTIREKYQGAEHPDTAASLNNLAVLYILQGQLDDAEPLYERALTIHETRLGSDHPYTATSLNNLAELYMSQGSWEAAEPLFKRALKIRETHLGTEHPATATSLNNLAGLYQALGRYDAAEPSYDRALAILEQALGPDHPDTITVRENLATLRKKMNP